MKPISVDYSYGYLDYHAMSYITVACRVMLLSEVIIMHHEWSLLINYM